MTNPVNIFIGYDSNEVMAYHVLVQSIVAHASVPVSITPLVRAALVSSGIYTRPRTKLESTEFSMTRFLVPYLSQYQGVSIFMDCDMLCLGDVAELVSIPFAEETLRCVQHDYTPSTTTKFLNHIQTPYPRKNWSSLMVFHNAFCQKLTPEYVNTASGLDLHRMQWADCVGPLPLEWNWLVGEYDDNPQAKLLHYTLGGPWFRDYQQCDRAQDWFDMLDVAFPSLNCPKPQVTHAGL